MKKWLAVLLCIITILASLSCAAIAANGNSDATDTSSPTIASLVKIFFGRPLSGHSNTVIRITYAMRDATAAAKARAEAVLDWFTRVSEPFNRLKWNSIFG